MSTTTAYEYDLNGNMTQKELPNGVLETRVYDTRNRVTSIHTWGLGLQSQFNYTYDAAGNVTEVDETYASGSGLPSRTIVNTYDGANRLAQIYAPTYNLVGQDEELSTIDGLSKRFRWSI